MKQPRQQLIAARVREARQSAGLSQSQVAKKLELHRPSVSEIEAGNRRVSAEELAKLADIFDVSLNYLMGEGPEVLAADDRKVQLAAQALQKLSLDALDGLLRAVMEMKWLKQLEEENQRLKKQVADLLLDKEMLQNVIRRKM